MHANPKSWYQRASWFVLGATLILTAATKVRSGDGAFTKGEQLFVKQFSLNSSGSNGGDGLGPMYNHVSCAACHRQGALGGGGGAELNVSLLCAQLEPRAQRTDPKL